MSQETTTVENQEEAYFTEKLVGIQKDVKERFAKFTTEEYIEANDMSKSRRTII